MESPECKGLLTKLGRVIWGSPKAQSELGYGRDRRGRKGHWGGADETGEAAAMSTEGGRGWWSPGASRALGSKQACPQSR